jgi:hypothetical protein
MSEVKTAVLIRTRHPRQKPTEPDATEYSYEWAGILKQQFETSGWQVIDLAIDNAITSQVESVLQDAKNEVVIFYGHGFPSCMIGQNLEAVINLNNMSLLKNKKVYVMACWTTQELGKKAESVVYCYLGYNQPVSFRLDYSDYLGKCVNKGILKMLNTDGCTFEDARQEIIAEYNYWIKHFKGKGMLAHWFATDLRENRDALRLFGDIGAKL